jgi:hypothetical protein
VLRVAVLRMTGVREAVMWVSGLGDLLIPILARVGKVGLLGLGLVHGRLLEVGLLDAMRGNV